MGKFQLFPDQSSTLAPQVDALFFYLCGVTFVFTAIIAGLILLFAIQYRRKSEAERPAETQTHKSLEIAWIVIPFVLVMIMFAWGAVIFVNYERPPANAMEINVVGKQWMWKIQHGDGQREINELHVPINQPVKLIMISQDVIHDFAVPDFRVKMDVLPGRYTTEWFQATQLGKHYIFCDQYCGTEHSRMVGMVTVMTQSDYQAWLSGQVRGLTVAGAGEELFRKYNCISCHSQYAPTMANLYNSKVTVMQDGEKKVITADDDYLRDSIINPSHQIVEGYGKVNMPSFKDRLSEEEVTQLVAYIKSLSVDSSGINKSKMINGYVPQDPSTPEMNGLLTK